MSELFIQSRFQGDPFTLTADLNGLDFEQIEPGFFEAYLTGSVSFESGPTLSTLIEFNIFDNYGDDPGDLIESLIIGFEVFDGLEFPGAWLVTLESTNFDLLNGTTLPDLITLSDFDQLAEAVFVNFETIGLAPEPIDTFRIGAAGQGGGGDDGSSAGGGNGTITQEGEVPDYITQIVLLYEAGLNRNGSFDYAGLNYWIDQFEAGLSLFDISFFFTQSPEFQTKTGVVGVDTDEKILENIYENVLDRASDPAGYAYWLGLLQSDQLEIHEALFYIAVDVENAVQSVAYTEGLQQVAPGEWDVLIEA